LRCCVCENENVILRVFDNKVELGKAAAQHACATVRRAIQNRGCARIIVATGTSQQEFLEALTKTAGIDWEQVEMFHLDEYVGLPETHPASFRKYLRERLIQKTGITRYHFLNGDSDPTEVIHEVGKKLRSAPIDVAFVGIGENGHLAFNDPPANFEEDEPYLIVELDAACRLQQIGEGWFANDSEVPRRAISMSIRQILKADEIICVVPEARKAKAVKLCLEGEIGPMAPASVLRTHPATTIFLDRESASLISAETLWGFARKKRH
jgi:glucosamine-6-phosphate deaminase